MQWNQNKGISYLTHTESHISPNSMFLLQNFQAMHCVNDKFCKKETQLNKIFESRVYRVQNVFETHKVSLEKYLFESALQDLIQIHLPSLFPSTRASHRRNVASDRVKGSETRSLLLGDADSERVNELPSRCMETPEKAAWR